METVNTGDLDGGGGGGGGAPSNKGGYYTNPAGTGKTAWQYLTSIWSNCLSYFGQDARFGVSAFESLLTAGISWLDTRAVGMSSVDSYAHNGDTQSLSSFLGGVNARTIAGTNYVAIGKNYLCAAPKCKTRE